MTATLTSDPVVKGKMEKDYKEAKVSDVKVEA
jgi:hypothetical protein